MESEAVCRSKSNHRRGYSDQTALPDDKNFTITASDFTSRLSLPGDADASAFFIYYVSGVRLLMAVSSSDVGIISKQLHESLRNQR